MDDIHGEAWLGIGMLIFWACCVLALLVHVAQA